MVDDLDADDPGPPRAPAASGRRWLLVLVGLGLVGAALAAIFVGHAAPPPPKVVFQTPGPLPITSNPSSFRLIGACTAITDGHTYVMETFRIENDGSRPARLTKLHALLPIGGLTTAPVIQANDGVCARRGTRDPDVVVPAGGMAGFSAVFDLAGVCPYDLPPTAYLDGTSDDGKEYLFPYTPLAGLDMSDFADCAGSFDAIKSA